MLKKKGTFKPKVAPGRLPKPSAPSTSQSEPQPPPPSPSPAPPSNDEPPQVTEPEVAPAPEPDRERKAATIPAPRTRAAEIVSKESSAVTAPPNAAKPRRIEPPAPKPQSVVQQAAVAQEKTAVEESATATEDAVPDPPASSATPQPAPVSLNPTPPATVERAPTPPGEDQPEPPAPKPRKPVPHSRKRPAENAEGDEGAEAGPSQAESSAQPKKKTRATKRAVALPGEEGHQTAAEKCVAAGTKARTRKRKAPAADEAGAESTEEGSAPRPKRKAPPRRERAVTPPDAEDVQIDENTVKMADLIKDRGFGKRFSKHTELLERERQQKLRKKNVTAEAAAADSTEKADAHTPSGVDNSLTPAAEPAIVGETYQLINGQIVLNESSLQVDRHAHAAAEAAYLEAQEEDEFTHKITSSTYLRRNMRGQQWTDEETALFYRGLSMFGADFETIARMFPGKQRKHIKLKYNREERNSPDLITAALVGKKTVSMDMEEYKRHTGSEYETAEAIYAEQEKAKEEFEAQQKAREEQKAEEERKKAEEMFGKKKDGEDGEGAKAKKKRGKKSKEVVW